MRFTKMWITITAIVIISINIVSQAQFQNTTLVLNNESNINSQMLLGDIIANSMKNFIPFSDCNKNCTRDGQEFLVNLKNQTHWAVRMYESSAKYPGGILSGEVTELGNFDQCMMVSSKKLGINGAYAVANIKFRHLNEDPNIKLLDFVQADRERSKRDLLAVGPEYLWWALCFPDSCTNKDIKLSVEHVLIPVYRTYNIVVEVDIPQSMYTSKNTILEYTKGVTIIHAFFIVSITLIVAGTLHDLLSDCPPSETSNFFNKCLCSFSIITNAKSLMQDPKSNEFAVINMLKMYGVIAIIIGHRVALDIGLPAFNPEYTEHIFTGFWSAFLKTPIVVEIFFVVSGFLTYIEIENRLRSGKHLNLIFLLIYRLIRILPTYVAVILIFSFILPYMGDGPLWKLIVYPEAEFCRKNWWTNLLFINNYVNTNEMCMLHTWYLACDIHFFIVGTLLTYFIWKWKKLGISIFSIVFAISIYIPAKSIYDNKYWGLFPFFHSNIKNVRTNEHFHNVYIKSHYRITTYLIGLASAYVYLRIKNSSFKFSVKNKTIGFVTILLLHFACFIVTGYFYLPDITYNPWFHILCYTFQRMIYSLTIAYVIVIGSVSGFGIINSLCENKLFTVIARIAYILYLIHYIVLFQSVGQIRQPQYGNFWILFWKINADVITTVVYALPINFIVETPYNKILNHLLHKFFQDEHNKLKFVSDKETNVQTTGNSSTP